ncbi:MAG: 2-dehydropantoate 2-reductase [Chloroflexota bacterium]|nr:2-dehydropantoate 2-reductase [Chloroflexota bacterium]
MPKMRPIAGELMSGSSGNSTHLRIGIIGAGAIGGWLGACLAEAGHAVSLVARGRHLDRIRERGLRVHTGGRTIEKVLRASDRPGDLGVQDYLLLTVKQTTLAETAPSVAPMIGPATTIVSLSNGVPWWFFDGLPGPYAGYRIDAVDPDGTIACALPQSQVIGGVVNASASIVEPGVIDHASGGLVSLGEIVHCPTAAPAPASGYSPSGSGPDRVARLAGALRDAGIRCERATDIRVAVWSKLMGNLCFNTVGTLAGCTTDRLIDDADTHRLVVDMMTEAQELGRALGLAIDVDIEQRIAATRKLGRIKSSMLQDTEAGKPIEFNAIIGAVVELADRVGLPMPRVRTIHAVLKLKAAQH